MDMQKIKLGTIGTGFIVRYILNGVKVTDGICCEAVYSRTREKGCELAEHYGVQKVYTDLDEMLRDEEINCIYIASPNNLHYEQTKKALLSGKHVICEKPFCTGEKQARELIGLAKERGLFLVDATPTAFLPNFEILKRELSKVGRVRLVLSSYSQYSSRYDQVREGKLPNVFNREFAGGCLMDINYYNVYLNVALFGRPIQTVYYPNIPEGLADTSGILMMQYEDFVSECAGAKDTWGVNSVQIQGEKGYIYVEGGSNGITSLKVVTKDGEAVFDEQNGADHWMLEVREITRLMLTDDHAAMYQRMDTMADVIGVIEEARHRAGIWFPGEESQG